MTNDILLIPCCLNCQKNLVKNNGANYLKLDHTTIHSNKCEFCKQETSFAIIAKASY